MLFLGIMFISVAKADVKTIVEIPNAPPYLIELIPNQTILFNTVKVNAFNLNDYFVDDNGDSMTFSFDPIDEIHIIIDSGGHVSFYPDENFMGIRTTKFYASDHSDTAESNLVYITVTEDTEPPQWFFPRRNRATVYQSSFVNFTTYWTDNFQLKYYIFSINQGGTWTNSPQIPFSGKQNTSRYNFQISSPPGSIVYWKFLAADESGNINETEVQSFNISSRITPELPETPGTGAVIAPKAPEKIEVSGLLIEPSFFRVPLKQGTTTTRVLKITNLASKNMPVKIAHEGLSNFISFPQRDTEFQLLAGESRDILVEFSASQTIKPDQYNGLILIYSEEDTSIPVIIDVNLFEQDFEIDIELGKIKSGKPIDAVIKVSNAKDIRETNATVYFAIKDFYGNTYDFGEKEINFETSVTLYEQLSLPEDITSGRFLFYVKAYNKDTAAVNSVVFELGRRFDLAGFIKMNFLIIVLLFGSIIISILAIKYKRYKDKEKALSLYLLLTELKNLIKEEKFESALEVYIRVKNMYREPIPSYLIRDKELLKEELKHLAAKLKEGDIISASKEDAKPEEKKEQKAENKDEKAEEKKPSENPQENPPEKKPSENPQENSPEKQEDKSEKPIEESKKENDNKSQEQKPEEKKEEKNEEKR
jgi:hypothetical protein